MAETEDLHGEVREAVSHAEDLQEAAEADFQEEDQEEITVEDLQVEHAEETAQRLQVREDFPAEEAEVQVQIENLHTKAAREMNGEDKFF